MRKVLLILCVLFSINSFATHLVGANITWECVGQNQYIFTLNFYRDCSPSTAIALPSYNINGPFGSITVNKDTVIDLTIPCTGSASPVCSGQNPKGVEFHKYVSTVQTLNGTPPVSGWAFSFYECCRSNSVVNIQNRAGTYARSIMYPNSSGVCSSSPYYDFNPAQQIISINNSLSSLAQSTNPADSLYYDLTIPMLDSLTSVIFEPGYSTTNPFPNAATDTANGPVTINHSNGLIEYDVKNGLPGLYAYAVVVEQWREGELLSKIFVDNSVRGDFSPDSNSAPIVTIDTAVYSNISRSGYVYKLEALAGDTVEFVIEGFDSDINTDTNLPQVINFIASGHALDSVWNNGNSFQHDATLTPVAPQSGFSSTVNNKVQFKWVIGEEHFAGKGTNHAFHFQFSDDQCPYVGMTNIIVEIAIKDGAFIKADTVEICQGDTAQLEGITASGNYFWTPSANLSADSIARPIVAPPTSQYYYLYDPTNPGFVDSVFVDVQVPGNFSLSGNGTVLTLTDNDSTTDRTWYFNGVPFSYAYDTLTAFGNGTYWVGANKGQCSYWSDTVTVLNGQSFSMVAPGNGAYQGSSKTITGSFGVKFQLNTHRNLQSVTIPGIKDLFTESGGYDLNLKLYDSDSANTELFSKDITLDLENAEKAEINVDYLLYANKQYTLAISGDTAYTFNLFEGAALPSSPFNNGITVLGAYEGQHKQFPTIPADYTLPIGLLTNNKKVAVDEYRAGTITIYPNPADHSFTLEGVSINCEVQLLDVHGKLIKSYSATETSLKIERGNLPSGVYFVKISDSNTTSLQKVMFK